MADGFVKVQPDSTGKIIDTSELTVNSQTVERQRLVIADPTVAAGLAVIMNANPAGTEYGLVVRTIPSGTQAVSAASLPLPTGAAQDSTLSTLSGKFTDDAATTSAASESATSRLSVAAVLRLLDTAQVAGSQLVAAKGDATSGLWVNIKSAIAITATQGTAAAVASAWPTKLTDGSNVAAITAALALKVDGSGVVQPTKWDPNQQAVQANATLTASGSQVYSGFTGTGYLLFINVKAAPTGSTPSLTYTIQEVDPGDLTTTVGSVVTGTAITAAGQQKLSLPALCSGCIKVSWTITGTTPSFTQVFSTLRAAPFVPMLTDGVSNGPVAVKGSSVGPSVTDPSLVVALSPNASIPTGSNTIGSVKVTDGTNVSAVKGASIAAVAADPAIVVALSPNNNTSANALYTRPRQLATYSATYRQPAATAGQVSLLWTVASTNIDKQLLAFYHPATAVKNVRIRRVSIYVSAGGAGVFGFELRRLNGSTAPATGNPAITPALHDTSDGAAETVCLALPTTAGTTNVDVPVSGHFEWNSAAAAATANPSGLSGQEIVLYEARYIGERKPLLMRAGIAEGLAIMARCTAAVTLRFTAIIEFTEE